MFPFTPFLFLSFSLLSNCLSLSLSLARPLSLSLSPSRSLSPSLFLFLCLSSSFLTVPLCHHSLAAFTSLRYLGLENNRLASLPGFLHQLRRLKQLHLEGRAMFLSLSLSVLALSLSPCHLFSVSRSCSLFSLSPLTLDLSCFVIS